LARQEGVLHIASMLQRGRYSGVLLPLFSLRRAGDFGIGDFGAAPDFIRWLSAAKQRLWMVLPLLPTAPNDASPYSTQSAFGLNPLFIDLSQVPEFQELGGDGLLSVEARERLEQARVAPRVRYPTVLPLKHEALRKCFERFDAVQYAQGTARAKEFDAYRETEGAWLSSYALFAAISRDRQLQGWWEWPEPLRDRHPTALEDAARRLAHEVRYHAWMQWTAETQWQKVRTAARAAGVLLCGDEPFIIGQDSADCWANPGLLRRDARLGVPPDAFSATGQDWGLPYFDFAAMERDGFAWLKLRAHKTAAYYDLRRVDHAVGYFRQWIRDTQMPSGRFVPPDEPAQQVMGERIFRMLGDLGAGIVAEDLGVIPDWVRQILPRIGIPGYRVLRWERDGLTYRDPRQFPTASLVTTGTHDTETLAESWELSSPDERHAIQAIYPELQGLKPLPSDFTTEVHQALLAVAEKAASNLCVLPWQDILGTRERINLPGSSSDANWSYRIASNADELLQREDSRLAAERLARLTEAAGR
jgi:4-alpha-glucanotransferase